MKDFWFMLAKGKKKQERKAAFIQKRPSLKFVLKRWEKEHSHFYFRGTKLTTTTITSFAFVLIKFFKSSSRRFVVEKTQGPWANPWARCVREWSLGCWTSHSRPLKALVAGVPNPNHWQELQRFGKLGCANWSWWSFSALKGSRWFFCEVKVEKPFLLSSGSPFSHLEMSALPLHPPLVSPIFVLLRLDW